MKSAILFLIFKREDTTKRVFERIRQAQPPKLYIAADGPRNDRLDETIKCEATRKVVEYIDWPCEVHRLYQDQNMGCGKGVSTAITWFFDHEEQGIIIEDDILPHLDFFSYCDEMLERYKNDVRIQLIAGFSSFYQGYKSDVSYYLSSHLEIWGWASWKRVWDTYEYDLKKLDSTTYKEKVMKRLPRKNAKYFIKLFEQMRWNPIDTWDNQFAINQFMYDRYTIYPYINMVENIGFGSQDAAHTISQNSMITNHKSNSIYPIRHPNPISVDLNADIITMQNQQEFVSPLYLRVYKKIISIIKGCQNKKLN